MTGFLVLAVLLTVVTSALCSILEAMVLSTRPTEIELLRREHPWRAEKLAIFTREIEATSAAILGLNTIANTAGSTVSGAIAGVALGKENVWIFSIGLTLVILIVSEVIPKNAGVLYRPRLQPILVFPLHWIRIVMTPLSYLCRITVRALFSNPPASTEVDKEIILLAEKSAKEGDLTESERKMVSNALRLDEVQVNRIMTPRTVMTALEASATVGDVFGDFRNIPFARIPVYRGTVDDIFGVVRRRDLLARMAEGKDDTPVEQLAREAIFIPDTATGADALQTFLRQHQQLAIVVDEFGLVAGVLTMEDVMEYILGQEIFEHDDVAIDMRELARKKSEKARKVADPEEGAPPRSGSTVT